MINKCTITGIAAINQQNILGIDGHMPWGRIKNDLQFYKEMTVGKSLICGGNTYRSLPPAALKNRQIFVLSRQTPNDLPDNVVFINEFLCPGFIIDTVKDYLISDEIMIVGGGLIYKVFEQQYDKFYLTSISGQEFETENKTVTYFDTDLSIRSKELGWKTSIYDWDIVHNDVGSFDVKIQELS